MENRNFYQNFMDLIHSRAVKGEVMDRLSWIPAKNRGFEVCSY